MADLAVVVRATGNDGGDGVPDAVVVGGELLPRHGVVRAEDGAGEFRDDGDLASHVDARRLQAAA